MHVCAGITLLRCNSSKSAKPQICDKIQFSRIQAEPEGDKVISIILINKREFIHTRSFKVLNAALLKYTRNGFLRNLYTNNFLDAHEKNKEETKFFEFIFELQCCVQKQILHRFKSSFLLASRITHQDMTMEACLQFEEKKMTNGLMMITASRLAFCRSITFIVLFCTENCKCNKSDTHKNVIT